MNMMKQKRIDYKYYYDSKKIFSLIQDRDWSTLLCSNNQMFKHERYDILTSNPIEKIYAYKDKTVVENKKGIEEIKEDPIVVLHKLMDKYKSDITDLPFVGGAIGYLSYDFFFDDVAFASLLLSESKKSKTPRSSGTTFSDLLFLGLFLRGITFAVVSLLL